MQVREIHNAVGSDVYLISCRLLKEISAFVTKEASRGFLQLLFTKGQRISQIGDYYMRIGISIDSFRASFDILDITSLINIGRNDSYPHC